MKIKTTELTGAALDWAVAECEGVTEGKTFAWYYDRRNTYKYSTEWAQGGPIIEREAVALEVSPSGTWYARIDLHEGDAMVELSQGPTPLIAAMRCYVASKLGDEVEIPEGL